MDHALAIQRVLFSVLPRALQVHHIFFTLGCLCHHPLRLSLSLIASAAILCAPVFAKSSTQTTIVTDKSKPSAAVNVFIGTGGDGHTFPARQ